MNKSIVLIIDSNKEDDIVFKEAVNCLVDYIFFKNPEVEFVNLLYTDPLRACLVIKEQYSTNPTLLQDISKEKCQNKDNLMQELMEISLNYNYFMVLTEGNIKFEPAFHELIKDRFQGLIVGSEISTILANSGLDSSKTQGFKDYATLISYIQKEITTPLSQDLTLEIVTSKFSKVFEGQIKFTEKLEAHIENLNRIITQQAVELQKYKSVEIENQRLKQENCNFMVLTAKKEEQMTCFFEKMNQKFEDQMSLLTKQHQQQIQMLEERLSGGSFESKSNNIEEFFMKIKNEFSEIENFIAAQFKANYQNLASLQTECLSKLKGESTQNPVIQALEAIHQNIGLLRKTITSQASVPQVLVEKPQNINNIINNKPELNNEPSKVYSRIHYIDENLDFYKKVLTDLGATEFEELSLVKLEDKLKEATSVLVSVNLNQKLSKRRLENLSRLVRTYGERIRFVEIKLDCCGEPTYDIAQETGVNIEQVTIDYQGTFGGAGKISNSSVEVLRKFLSTWCC